MKKRQCGRGDDDDEESETVDASSSSSTTMTLRSSSPRKSSIKNDNGEDNNNDNNNNRMSQNSGNSNSSSNQSKSGGSAKSNNNSSSSSSSQPSSAPSKSGNQEKQQLQPSPGGSGSSSSNSSSTKTTSSNVSGGGGSDGSKSSSSSNTTSGSGNSSSQPSSAGSSSSSLQPSSAGSSIASQPAALRSAMGRTRSMRMRQQQQLQKQQQQDQALGSNNNNSNNKTNKSTTTGVAASSPANSNLDMSTSSSSLQRRVRFQLSNSSTSSNNNNKNGAKNHNDIPQGKEKRNVKTETSVKQDKKSQGRDDEDESSSLTTSSLSSSSSMLKNQNKKPAANDDGVATTNNKNKTSNSSSLNDQKIMQRPPNRPVKSSSNGDDDKKSTSRPPKALFSSSSTTTGAPTKQPTTKKQHQQRSIVKVMDIHAANNASRNQMLEDEVYDLCDSIRSTLTVSNNINNGEETISCLEAAVELAFIVSVRKQRQVLFRKHFQMVKSSNNSKRSSSSLSGSSPLGKEWGSGGGNSPSPRRGERNDDDDDDGNHDDDEVSPLGAILDLLAWMTTRSTLTAADVEEDHENDHDDDDDGIDSTTNNALPAAAAAATVTGRTRTGRASQVDRADRDKGDGKKAHATAVRQAPLVWHVMAMIVHFLSLDCTIQTCDIETLGCSQWPSMASSSSSSLLASPSRKKLLDSIKSFRHSILSHASGLQGMLWLVLQETSLANTTSRRKQGSGGSLSSSSLPGSPCSSVVGSVVVRRGAPPLVSSVPMALGGPNQNNNNNSNAHGGGGGGGASVASSCSSSPSSLGSVGSTKALDPTAAGRKRRRKMRLPLPTINEDGIGSGGGGNTNNNPPPLFKRRKRQENKKQLGNDEDGDDMSFSLESPTPPRRTLVSRQLENFSADDFSSLASSTTASTAAGANDAASQVALEQANETQEKLDRVISRVLESMPEETNDKQTAATEQQEQHHSCGTKTTRSDEPNSSIALWQRSTRLHLPLVALNRIVTGRMEGMDRGCLDEDLQAFGNPEAEDDNEDLENTEHPQMLTNRFLFEAGVIPLLSQAMSETAMAIVSQLKRPKTTKTASPPTSFPCGACVSHLQKRMSMLRSLVDDACSFNDANRKSICQEGYTVDAGGFLIVNLVSVLAALTETNNLFVDGGLGEIGFEVLRTLNGLAHENKVAAKELEMSLDYSKVVGAKTDSASSTSMNDNHCTGLDVVARVLFLAVDETAENDKCPDDNTSSAVDKLIYDAKVFCLTILGNALESGASRRIFAEMKLSPKDVNDSADALLFLPWLVKFLCNETRPFRDAVLGSTFGSSPTKHSDRRLDQQEDEKLFTAGYGLTLVTSLLVGPIRSTSMTDSKHNDIQKTEDNSLRVVMRELILPELPGDDEEAKLMFVKNTLKAFCNLYHFSVNEDLGLSMLVLAPIKKLLVELDRSMSEKID